MTGRLIVVLALATAEGAQPEIRCGKRHLAGIYFELAHGWSTDAPCQVSIDRVTFRSGGASARISHGTDADRPDAGSTYVTQRIQADPFRGKRVAFAAHLRTKDVTRRAQLTFNIAADSPPMDLGRDQMDDRFVRSTTDWTRYELVLDVPVRASTLLIGFELEGSGHAWLDDAEVRVVPSTTPLTAADNGVSHFVGRALTDAAIERRRKVQATALTQPDNLGFEK